MTEKLQKLQVRKAELAASGGGGGSAKSKAVSFKADAAALKESRKLAKKSKIEKDHATT